MKLQRMVPAFAFLLAAGTLGTLVFLVFAPCSPSTEPPVPEPVADAIVAPEVPAASSAGIISGGNKFVDTKTGVEIELVGIAVSGELRACLLFLHEP